MAYTNDQIKQFVDAQGISNDPYAISNYARQYGVSDSQVADALGYTGDQVSRFRQNLWGYQDRQNGQATNEDVQRTMGGGVDFGANSPHKAFAAAQLNHWTPQQADQALGLGAGASANWAKQQGLQWGDWSGNTPAPTRYSQMMTQPQGPARPRNTWGGGADAWDGGAPSTAGSTAGPMGQSYGGWTPMTGQSMGSGVNGQMVGSYKGPGGFGGDTGSGYLDANGQYVSNGPTGGMNVGPAGGQHGGINPGGMYGGSSGGMPSNPWMQQTPFSQNPATNWMAQSIIGDANQAMGDQLAGIRRGAIQAGGLGGSRQGLAEGNAIGQGMRGLSGNLANLYSGQYNQDRNYGLQSDQLDFSIYQGNNAIQRQAQQDQIGLADRMLGWNQQYGIGNANNVQNTPLNYWQQFGNMATQMGGMGGTNSQQMQGNSWLGALGGAMTGYNLYNNWGR